MQSLLNLILFLSLPSLSFADLAVPQGQSAKVFTTPPSFAGKPSLKSFGNALQSPSQITELFKATSTLLKSKPNPKDKEKLSKDIARLWKLNAKLMREWIKNNQESNPYLRGEIDEEPVLNNLLVAVQLSVLQGRADGLNGQWMKIKEDLNPWFTYASDMTYEEASLISLRLANLIRSLLLDELETIENAQAKSFSSADLEAWSAWVSAIRVSWPIDRVLITEAKKILTNKPMFTAQQMAIALQKNAYQTAAQALKEAQGPKTPELKLLEKMWREEDIQAMKTEVHRVSALKIRLAKDEYAQKFAKEPAQIQDLVDQHLLKETPLDYSTGKAFTLQEAALH